MVAMEIPSRKKVKMRRSDTRFCNKSNWLRDTVAPNIINSNPLLGNPCIGFLKNKYQIQRILDSSVLKLFHYEDIHLQIALANNVCGK